MTNGGNMPGKFSESDEFKYFIWSGNVLYINLAEFLFVHHNIDAIIAMLIYNIPRNKKVVVFSISMKKLANEEI